MAPQVGNSYLLSVVFILSDFCQVLSVLQVFIHLSAIKKRFCLNIRKPKKKAPNNLTQIINLKPIKNPSVAITKGFCLLAKETGY